MPQILIVSNRLPVTVTKQDGVLEYQASMGGVATGLASFVKSRKNIWIGWPGIASEELTDADKHAITVELAKRNCAPVFLSQRQLDDFYNGYCNSRLWPLFHNMAMAKPKPGWWKAYMAVNTAFKDAVLDAAKKNSSVWVQDYQLFLLPDQLKQNRPDMHIGFFLHIPFPDKKAYAKLPEAERLLKGILGADLVGFHTPGYVANFIQTVQSFDLGLSSNNQLILPDRTVRVTDFPMGIDYDKFTAARKIPSVKAAVKDLRRKYKGQKIIAGVDRLDITKGFVERLIAYRDFLRQYPREHGKVVFVLVGAPSRGEVAAYRRLSVKVEKLVQEINDEFATAKWLPVDYNNKGLQFEAVTALFQIADVAFIAPLRDGMNLVAKEYIASKKKNGILILSDTAGAAQELQDALLVSHKKPDTLVAALDQALHMRRREVRGRFKRMQKHLASNTVHTWASDFMETLQKPVPGTPRLLTRSLNHKAVTTIHTKYLQAQRRLIVIASDSLVLDNQSHLKILETLSADPQNTIIMHSPDARSIFSNAVIQLPINFIAEAGAVTRKTGNASWRAANRNQAIWKRYILPVLQKYADLTPQAMVVEKPYAIEWHYKNAPPYFAQKYAVIIRRILKPYLKEYGLDISQADKRLVVKDSSISTPLALDLWLKRSYDFQLAIGTDESDEAIFTQLPLNGVTVRVRRGRTAARYRLANSDAVADFLSQLTSKTIA